MTLFNLLLSISLGALIAGLGCNIAAAFEPSFTADVIGYSSLFFGFIIAVLLFIKLESDPWTS